MSKETLDEKVIYKETKKLQKKDFKKTFRLKGKYGLEGIIG